MTSTYELLKARQSEFNTFNSTVVHQLVGLNEEEMDNLGFAEVAKRICDLDIRKRYCELAFAMLDANIAHYRSDATIMPVPDTTIIAPEWNNSGVVASTLVVSAIAYYLGGTISALLAAAAWYRLSHWLSNKAASYRTQQLSKEAMAHQEAVIAHNELVAEWAATLEKWEAVCGELRAM